MGAFSYANRPCLIRAVGYHSPFGWLICEGRLWLRSARQGHRRETGTRWLGDILVLPLLLWVVVVTALSCLFGLLSYATRAFRRVQLEEAFPGESGKRRVDWLDDRLNGLRLMLSLLRSLANIVLVLLIVWILHVYTGHGKTLHIVWSAAFSIIVVAVFGVGVPNAWAAGVGERMLAAFYPALVALYYITWPAIQLMQVFDVPVRRLSGVPDTEDNDNGDSARQEILSVASESRAGGDMDAEELEMIESVMEFRETHAGEIMTPRTDIFALPADMPFDEAVARIVEAGHTRVPVYRGDIDDIVGILYAKDLLRYLDSPEPATLTSVVRKPFFVPESKLLDDLLAEFKARKLHMSVVLEDVIEEIVGEITDEYDVAEPEPIQKVDDATVEADGRAYIDDLNDALGLAIPEDEDYDTAAGLVLSELGHVPTSGETIDAYSARFTVLDADERKINRLRVEKLPEVEADMDS